MDIFIFYAATAKQVKYCNFCHQRQLLGISEHLNPQQIRLIPKYAICVHLYWPYWICLIGKAPPTAPGSAKLFYAEPKLRFWLCCFRFDNNNVGVIFSHSALLRYCRFPGHPRNSPTPASSCVNQVKIRHNYKRHG